MAARATSDSPLIYLSSSNVAEMDDLYDYPTGSWARIAGAGVAASVTRVGCPRGRAGALRSVLESSGHEACPDTFRLVRSAWLSTRGR
jgi:hypothetical protein